MIPQRTESFEDETYITHKILVICDMCAVYATHKLQAFFIRRCAQMSLEAFGVRSFTWLRVRVAQNILSVENLVTHYIQFAFIPQMNFGQTWLTWKVWKRGCRLRKTLRDVSRMKHVKSTEVVRINHTKGCQIWPKIDTPYAKRS